MMNDDEMVLAGKIGLGLTGSLWLLASWRLIFHTLVRRKSPNEVASSRHQTRQAQNLPQQEEPQSPQSETLYARTRWFTRRRTFHVLLWMATSLEALAYADLSNLVPLPTGPAYSDKVGYILLDISGRCVFELLAFSTVTGIWLHTAIESSPSVSWSVFWDSQTLRNWRFRLLPSLFLVVILMLVLSSTTLAVVVFVKFRDESLDAIHNLSLSRAQTLLEAITWGLHSAVVIECLLMTTNRVLTLVPSSDWKKRLSLLSKAVLPMFVNSLVYAGRSIWLLCVYFNLAKRGTWGWWIGFVWCPTFIASSMLLYSARKRDHRTTAERSSGEDPTASDSNDLQQPLLVDRPRPPAEAFLAFALYRQGADYDDSFSLCRSPVPHVITRGDDGDTADPEVGDEESLSTESQAIANAP